MKPQKTIRKVRAAKGLVLPLFYKDAIIHIDANESVEIDLDALRYEPKIQFLKALNDKILIEESGSKK